MNPTINISAHRILLLVLFFIAIFSSGSLLLVPNTHAKEPPKYNSISIDVKSAVDAAEALVIFKKEDKAFNNQMNGFSEAERIILYNVMWIVISYGEYSTDLDMVNPLFNRVDGFMKDIIIPPWVCFPEEYHVNFDHYVLPEPKNPLERRAPGYREASIITDMARKKIDARIKNNK